MNNDFIIADFPVRIVFNDTHNNNMGIIRSFEPFRTNNHNSNPLFTLTVDDSLRPVKKDLRQRIDTFDTGNGDAIVDSLADGGYQFIIKNIDGRGCCLLQTNDDFSCCRCALNGDRAMRLFGLNSALMIVFALAASKHDAIMMHAALVRHGGRAYAFTAKSGTGKSTHASMWMRVIPGTDLMNDDNPVIRVIDGRPIVYGSPWSGKTPCYRQTKAPLAAVVRIDRAEQNRIERLSTLDAFASILPSCSNMRWDTRVFDDVCNTITRLVAAGCAYIMHCLPDEDAAWTCLNGINKFGIEDNSVS